MAKYSLDCDDNFKVESDDKDEVIKMGRMHVKEKHNMDPSDEEMEKKIMED